MKKIACILLIILVFSCKNESNKTPLLDGADIDYETVMESKAVTLSEINSYEALSIEKLTAYFDLLKLKEKHPEFKDDIEQQLQSFSNDALLDYAGDFSIDSICQIGEVENISDSIRKIKLIYNVVSDTYNGKDSISAVITFKTIKMDGRSTASNKVLFLKE